jgi:hypothetical protein
MPFIIRDTNKPKEQPERAELWKQFQARAKAEGHTLLWVIWALIRRYVEKGLN